MRRSFVLGWGFGTITKTDFMGFHGILWDFMGFHGISWDFMGFHGISWDFMGFHGIFLILVAVGQHFVSEGFVDDR